MKREKLMKLAQRLDREIKKAENFAKKTKEAAVEIAREAALSPSHSGDRTHSEGQAVITAESLEKLVNLKNEVETCLNSSISEIVEPNSFVSVQYDGGAKDEFYLVNTPTLLIGFRLVSASSSLGQAISGKKVGDKFSYKSSGKDKTGVIISIE